MHVLSHVLSCVCSLDRYFVRLGWLATAVWQVEGSDPHESNKNWVTFLAAGRFRCAWYFFAGAKCFEDGAARGHTRDFP